MEIRSGGREEGTEAKLQRKGRMYDEGFGGFSHREGDGKEDDDGLALYDGIGLGNDEDIGLG